MKTTCKTGFILLAVLIFCSEALSDRPLEKPEILQIFETLTSQPRKTWIRSGTIYASHEEYRAPKTTDDNEIADAIAIEVQAYVANPNKLELTEGLQQMKLEAIPFNVRYRLSNEYTMVSNVTVKYDGSRFYWEINVDSRTDSVEPRSELAGNGYTEQFDLYWNEQRVFAWDGESYVNYFRPGNHATITDTPSPVNGPLTAGLIPWGYGYYTFDRLSNAESSAAEVDSDGQSEIHLTVVDGDRDETFVLNPARDFAVKRYVATVGNSSMIVRNYSNYQLVSSNWCPESILIEQYDITTQPHKLTAYDVWDFNSISNSTPEVGSFDVDFEYGTLIEDFRFGEEPLQYRYFQPQEPSAANIDVNKLLQNRREIAFTTEPKAQNCATVSLKYACAELGYNPSWKDLDQLVHVVEKSTNMFEMQQFVLCQGLESIAVKTDLKTLERLDNCQAILHLPDDDHFVVLGDVDEKKVGLIDLEQNIFYYRTSVESFNKIWDGTALVLSSWLIPEASKFTRIDDSSLEKIVGADECQECTLPCGGSGTTPCAPGCTGSERVYYTRTCCQSGTGTCDPNTMPVYKESKCIVDPITWVCGPDGDWTDGGSISACL